MAKAVELDPQLAEYILDWYWPIFPCQSEAGSRAPTIRNGGGFYGASTDPQLVLSWLRQYPRAQWAVRTGEKPPGAGIVVIDVDPEHDGFVTLALLIGPKIPEVPRATSPSSGGLHLHYLSPRPGIFSTVGQGGRQRRGLGPGLDVKANLSQCHVPGPAAVTRYHWDPEFNLHTCPLLPLPLALTPTEIPDQEDNQPVSPRRPIGSAEVNYVEAAIRNACQRIRAAVPGEQRPTLNGETLAIARYVAGVGLDRASVARDLIEAGMAMQNQAGAPPWRRHEVQKTVLDALADGARRPRVPQLRRR